MNIIEKKLAELNGTLDVMYAQEVSRLIRIKYTQSEVEAILNNYIDDSTNEKYIAEFKALQIYRAECKAKAKAEIYGEEV